MALRRSGGRAELLEVPDSSRKSQGHFSGAAVLHRGPPAAVPVDSHTYYCTYGPMVLRRCRKLLGDDQTARDAMHDVFVQVLTHSEELADQAPSSLLFRIATNVCLNRIRSRRRRPEDGDPELLVQIAQETDPAARSAARAALDALFRHEPEDTALIAVLHLHDRMTLQEVAAEVGMSVSGVRKRLEKLRMKLHALEVQP
ncbi:MAG: sigma-70 family RNA polymerase sigma factor [Deltaproteobacteria bacterium]|nr:MAG: sigma-70 family RNA polymerase sigma factor [Deltaproteobacteria bacterium]TMQ23380.1 MAG: sigma-70 family RNA polymerase sigma factor [Deltaproteobacteria bacterium]